jgi:uncharacterized protein YciI
MPYFIETWDDPARAHLRRELREEHLRYWDAHASELLAAGAKLEDDGTDAGGGIFIVDTDDRARAERLIADDPFRRHGLHREVLVTRWRRAYFDGKNRLGESGAS